MTRETSIEAYQKIQANGLLSKRRWEVYDWIYNNGPCVGNDIPIDGGWKVTSQLKKIGVLKEVGEGISKKTGFKGVLWDVTEKIPEKIKSPTLADLGVKTLEEYYVGDHWQQFRQEYYTRHQKKCWITGRTDNVDLHHVNYDCLGEEEDEDVIPLCREMHEKVHRLVKEFKIPLSVAHLVLKDCKEEA